MIFFQNSEVECPANNYNSSLVSKEELTLNSSLDRFGDDLTELIVSYLPITDKIRFECLSKQIQSLIFNKQFRLALQSHSRYDDDDSDIDKLIIKNKANLKLVLNKLKFLITLDNAEMSVDGDMFRLIADHCPRLRHLSFGLVVSCRAINAEDIAYFGKKCGQRLKSLKLTNKLNDWEVIQLLTYTSNLIHTDVKLSQLLREDAIENSGQHFPLLHKLREYSSGDHYFYEDFDLAQFTQFSNNYRKGITKLNLPLNQFTPVMTSKAMPLIADFHNP